MRKSRREGSNLCVSRIGYSASKYTSLCGKPSPNPASPDELPQYESLIRPVSAAATNIIYVEYDFAADNGMGPWSAVEDKEGSLGVPYYGRANGVGRLDPKTCEQTPFQLRSPKLAALASHAWIPAPE